MDEEIRESLLAEIDYYISKKMKDEKKEGTLNTAKSLIPFYETVKAYIQSDDCSDVQALSVYIRDIKSLSKGQDSPQQTAQKDLFLDDVLQTARKLGVDQIPSIIAQRKAELSTDEISLSGSMARIKWLIFDALGKNPEKCIDQLGQTLSTLLDIKNLPQSVRNILHPEDFPILFALQDFNVRSVLEEHRTWGGGPTRSAQVIAEIAGMLGEADTLQGIVAEFMSQRQKDIRAGALGKPIKWEAKDSSQAHGKLPTKPIMDNVSLPNEALIRSEEHDLMSIYDKVSKVNGLTQARIEQLHMDAKRDFDHLARIKIVLFEKILEQLNQPIDYQGEDAAEVLLTILNTPLTKDSISKAILEKHDLPIIYALQGMSIGQVLQIPRAGWGSSTHSWETILNIFKILGKSPPENLLIVPIQKMRMIRADLDAVHNKFKQISEIIRRNIAALSGLVLWEEIAKVKKDIFERIDKALGAYIDFSDYGEAAVDGKTAVDILFKTLEMKVNVPEPVGDNKMLMPVWQALSIRRFRGYGPLTDEERERFDFGETKSIEAILKIWSILDGKRHTLDEFRERLKLEKLPWKDSTAEHPRSRAAVTSSAPLQLSTVEKTEIDKRIRKETKAQRSSLTHYRLGRPTHPDFLENQNVFLALCDLGIIGDTLNANSFIIKTDRSGSYKLWYKTLDSTPKQDAIPTNIDALRLKLIQGHTVDQTTYTCPQAKIPLFQDDFLWNLLIHGLLHTKSSAPEIQPKSKNFYFELSHDKQSIDVVLYDTTSKSLVYIPLTDNTKDGSLRQQVRRHIENGYYYNNQRFDIVGGDAARERFSNSPLDALADQEKPSPGPAPDATLH